MNVANDHRRSQARAMLRARQPKSLRGYVHWVRWTYRQEPPTKMHTHDAGDGGTPAWHPAFAAWLEGADTACATDEEGYYRTPLRCALYRLHGRSENTDDAAVAHLLIHVAASTGPADDVAAAHGIEPPWTRRMVLEAALERLWNGYSPLPR